MTTVARAYNACNNQVDLSIWQGNRKVSEIRIPRNASLIRSALNTYRNLEYKPTPSLPKHIRGAM